MHGIPIGANLCAAGCFSQTLRNIQKRVRIGSCIGIDCRRSVVCVGLVVSFEICVGHGYSCARSGNPLGALKPVTRVADRPQPVIVGPIAGSLFRRTRIPENRMVVSPVFREASHARRLLWASRNSENKEETNCGNTLSGSPTVYAAFQVLHRIGLNRQSNHHLFRNKTTVPYHAVLKTRLYAFTLPMPVAKSHP